MLDNLDAVAVQRSNATRMIGHKPDASNIKVQQDLSADSDLALCCPLKLQRSLFRLFIVELQRVRSINLCERESKRVLMQVNHSANSLTGDSLQRGANV